MSHKARNGLRVVARGEDQTINGWLAYGEAMNEGRKLHDGDLEFGRWVRTAKLAEGVHDQDRAAAMWVAEDNPHIMSGLREGMQGLFRTVKDNHAEWQSETNLMPVAAEGLDGRFHISQLQQSYLDEVTRQQVNERMERRKERKQREADVADALSIPIHEAVERADDAMRSFLLGVPTAGLPAKNED